MMDEDELAVRISTDVETLILEYAYSARDVRALVENGIDNAEAAQE